MSPLLSITRGIASHPRLTVLAILALTCFAAAGIVDPWTGALRLRMDASTASLFPDDDDRAGFHASVRKRFGDDDGMLIVLASDDLFTRARLQQVVDTTRRIQALPGVHDVLSLATALGVSGDGAGIEVGSPLSPLPNSPEALAALRSRLP